MRQHFALKRHLLRAALYRKQPAAWFVAWCEVTALAQNPPYSSGGMLFLPLLRPVSIS
jgi:putative transposase